MFVAEVITGPKNGAIAVVSNGETVYEIHPLGNSRDREFYYRPAAETLAANHAAFLNAGGTPHSSFVRR